VPEPTRAKPLTGTILFGPFAFDVERRLLLQESQVVPLGSRALDILIVFLGHPGVLMSTQELITCAWPRSTAVRDSLRPQIFALRRALGDGEKGRRFIQTVPGRGYRFVCPLENQPRTSPTESLALRHHETAEELRMVGRHDIVAAILSRLQHRRLLTIVGPGGIGKTTVARAIASAFGPACADGVQWVDLSALTRDDSVAEAIAVAIGLVNFTSDHSPAVISWLKGKHLLLVMDCYDRVVGSTATLVERILTETSNVRILATSRETLRAAGEHVVRLPPLSAPPPAAGLLADKAMTYPAMQLFAERAAYVLGGFTLRDQDVPYVARICARLDGIALAIELAAGHLIAIELRKLADLLDDKFRLLPIGPRSALPRHKTMRAVLEWSYDQLSPTERNLLVSLAIFEGDSDIAAIGAVMQESETSAQQLVEAISRLVDKSLVATRITAAGMNYYLLDTTRAFALECLEETGHLEEISRRHAEFTLEVLRRIEIDNAGFREANWFDVRRRELPNMRAALDWAYASEAGGSLRLPLSAVAARILLDLALYEQGRRRIIQALEVMAQRQIEDLALEMRLKALLGMASFYTPGPISATVETLERVVVITESLHDVEYGALALWGLWSVSIFRNEPQRAIGFAAQFGSTPANLPGPMQHMLVDRMTGTALHVLGDQPGARDHLERVSAAFDPALHVWKLGLHVDHGLMARIYLARVLWLQGEPERALRTCRDSLEALWAQGHTIAQCHALFEVAIPLNYMSGDIEAAHGNLALLQDLAAKHGLSTFQAGAAWAAAAFSAIEHRTALSACRSTADALRACRYEVQYPWLSALMAEEALRRGDAADGIEWLSPCLTRDGGGASGWWLAELQRLRGELAAAGATEADREVAVAHLQQAIDTARRQGALMLELRATISRIAMDRGRYPETELKSELDTVLARFQDQSGSDLIAARRLSADLAG